MDTSAPDISFDAAGICSYCAEFIDRSGHILAKGEIDRSNELAVFVERVKSAGRGKPYDCVIGVSGGVDSSWVLVQAVRLGLRPLAVHMDNGWNSELAQNNIANLVRGLGVDLYTHVIDWSEYRALMQAFFDADVVDVELLYDNAMQAVNFQQASKHGVKFILSGSNQATEGMNIPTDWNWFKYDSRNIRSIGKQFGGVKLKSFPTISTVSYIYYSILKKIKWIPFLDYLPYNKFESLDSLEREFAYKRYPFKHYESIFTRFYQGYLLPRKFGVDKRRLHLSTLIISGQMSREAALLGLQGTGYPSEQAEAEDIKYFLKKMGWSRGDLDTYLARPRVEHDFYPSERRMWQRLAKLYARTST